MLTFVVLAAALSLVVVVGVTLPLLRRAAVAAAPAPWTALATGCQDAPPSLLCITAPSELMSAPKIPSGANVREAMSPSLTPWTGTHRPGPGLGAIFPPAVSSGLFESVEECVDCHIKIARAATPSPKYMTAYLDAAARRPDSIVSPTIVSCSVFIFAQGSGAACIQSGAINAGRHSDHRGSPRLDRLCRSLPASS